MACRALHDGALMLLFGAALFAAALVPASLCRDADRRVARIAGTAIPLAVLATLVRVPLAGAAMGGGWPDALDLSTSWTVLVDTAFGRAWLLHGVVVAMLPLYRLSPRRGRMALLATLSALALATGALVGHAVMRGGGVGWFDRATLVLHLLAMAAWIGSLPEVLALMRRIGSRELDDTGTRRDAATALRRFSTAGHGVVALGIAAGLLATIEISGSPRALLASAYGVVLGGKAALAAGMVGLAVTNRYRLVSRLPRDPEGAGRALVGNTRLVLGFGFAALALAALLGLLDPP